MSQPCDETHVGLGGGAQVQDLEACGGLNFLPKFLQTVAVTNERGGRGALPGRKGFCLLSQHAPQQPPNIFDKRKGHGPVRLREDNPIREIAR